MSAATPATQRHRLPPEVRRERLLEAAAEVFAARGYEGARVEQIAEAAGISAGLIYRHFDGKRELFEELLRQGARQLLEQTAAAAAPDHEGVERLERGIDAFLAFVQENRDLWRMMMRDEPEPGLVAIREGMYDAAVETVTQLLAQDPEATRQHTSERELKLVAVVITGAARSLASWWTEHPEVPREELLATLMATLWLGLDRVRGGQRYECTTGPDA
jgi:AcrR family transcriptional regulator